MMQVAAPGAALQRAKAIQGDSRVQFVRLQMGLQVSVVVVFSAAVPDLTVWES